MKLLGRITVYSITGCPHCKAAKGKLKELELPFTEVNLDDFPDQRPILIDRTQKRTVPQIFFNEKFIGGNDDFQELDEAELKKLITYVKENPVPETALSLPEMKNAEEGKLQEKGNQSEEYGANSLEIELAALVKEVKEKSGIIKTHRRMLLFSVPDSFTGESIIAFISEKKSVDVNKALSIAQDLMKYKFIVSVEPQADHVVTNDKTLYRLVEHYPEKALNIQTGSYESTTPASALSASLRKKILQLYGKYLSDDGKSVDYEGIGKSEEFKEYVDLTAKLQRLPLEKLNREQKLAFFINIYNALVIHGNVVYGFPENTLQRYKFFNTTRYVIGGDAYSLQDIENGVLRSNRKGVGMVTKPFGSNDPRLEHIVVPNEPLIHVALVCGAKSCPPIKTYSAENVMSELALSATSFLESEDGCLVKLSKNAVHLSMIFKWYSEDFGKQTDETLKWIHNHMADGKKKNDLHTVMTTKNHAVEFLTYDWGTNKK